MSILAQAKKSYSLVRHDSGLTYKSKYMPAQKKYTLLPTHKVGNPSFQQIST